MSQPILAVIFDMDDVLCRYNFEARLDAIARLTGKSPQAVNEAIWESGFDEDGDRGRYSAEEYLAEFNRRLDASVTEQEWLAARAESIEPNEAVLDMARRISSRMTATLLTNNGPVFKRGMAHAFPQLLDIFGERAFCAYEFGGAKPEPEVFENLASKLELRPETLFFIDDTREYIAGAASVGLKTHHFSDAQRLEADLGERGLL